MKRKAARHKKKRTHRNDTGDVYMREYMRERREKPSQDYLDSLWKAEKWDELEKELQSLHRVGVEERRHLLQQTIHLLSKQIDSRYKIFWCRQFTFSREQLYSFAANDFQQGQISFYSKVLLECFDNQGRLCNQGPHLFHEEERTWHGFKKMCILKCPNQNKFIVNEILALNTLELPSMESWVCERWMNVYKYARWEEGFLHFYDSEGKLFKCDRHIFLDMGSDILKDFLNGLFTQISPLIPGVYGYFHFTTRLKYDEWIKPVSINSKGRPREFDYKF